MVANVTIKRSKHVQDGNTDHTSANCLHFDKTCRKCGKPIIWRVRVDLLELCSPRQREAARRVREAMVQAQPNTLWNCGENEHLSSQCPKKKVHAGGSLITASQEGSQDTTMVGAVGSFLGLGSLIEGIPERRGASAKICSQVCAKVSSLTSRSIQVLK